MMAFGKPTGSLLFALLILIKCTSCTLIPNTQGTYSVLKHLPLVEHFYLFRFDQLYD